LYFENPDNVELRAIEPGGGSMTAMRGTLCLIAALFVGITASSAAFAQSSHPPLEGGLSPSQITVTSNQLFYVSLWSRDFDTDEFGAIFCNSLTTVTAKQVTSGRIVYRAHTSFEGCKHTFAYAVRARAVSETQIFLDVYEVADLNPYLNDGKFDIAMIVTVTPPPPTDPPGGS